MAAMARMGLARWTELKWSLLNGHWLSEETGRELTEEMEAGWATIEQQAAHIDALEAAGETLLGSTERAPVTALEVRMVAEIEAASAVLTALGHPDNSKSLAQRITESHEEDMRNLRAARDAATRRVAHAHDAAGALYKAASLVLDPDIEKGDTISNIITWFRNLKDEDDYSLSEDIETGCEALQHVIERLAAALDPEQQAAALREVQRRDGLDGQIAALRAEVAGLRGQLAGLLAPIDVNEHINGVVNELRRCSNISAIDARAIVRPLVTAHRQLAREVERLSAPRPMLTEEAARRLHDDAKEAADRVNNALVFEDAETMEGDMDKIYAALDALQQAARGEWATASAVHEAAQPSGLMLNLDPVLPAITLPAPTPAQSTREIHEQLIRGWEALAAHGGAPLPLPRKTCPIHGPACLKRCGSGPLTTHPDGHSEYLEIDGSPGAHDTAEMAVTTGEAAPAAADGEGDGSYLARAMIEAGAGTRGPHEADCGCCACLAPLIDALKSEAGRRAFNAYPSPDPFDPQAFIAAQEAHTAAKKEAP